MVSKHVLRVPIVHCLGDNHSEESSDTGPPHVTNNSDAEVTVDLKLPRRSLLVHFTCNACGERTQKLISRLAYERGTVFVQGLRSMDTSKKVACRYHRHVEPRHLWDTLNSFCTHCAGCLQHHKLIDNLGLVFGYDFRDDNGMDLNADQVRHVQSKLKIWRRTATAARILNTVDLSRCS